MTYFKVFPYASSSSYNKQEKIKYTNEIPFYHAHPQTSEAGTHREHTSKLKKKVEVRKMFRNILLTTTQHFENLRKIFKNVVISRFIK